MFQSLQFRTRIITTAMSRTRSVQTTFIWQLITTSTVLAAQSNVGYVRSFIDLQFSPLPLTVDYGTTATGYINITMKDYDVIYNSSSSRQPSTGSLYTVYPCCPNEQIAVILTNSTRFTFSLSHDQPWAVRTLSVSGLQIGRTSVRFYVISNNTKSKSRKIERHAKKDPDRKTHLVMNSSYDESMDLSDWRIIVKRYLTDSDPHSDSSVSTKWWLIGQYEILVLRHKRTMETWMHYTTTALITISIAAVGGQLSVARIIEHLKKPVVICIGVVCRFGVMPLLGLGLVELVTPDPHIALSVLSFLCSPHEGIACLLILLSGSDLTLSFLLMNIINILSLGMFPIWSVIFEKLAGQDLLTVPYQDLLFTVSYTSCSAVIGLVMKAKLKRAYNTIWQHIPTLTTVTVVFMLVTEGYKYPYIYQLLTPTYLIVSCILAVAGFLFGFALAFICRQQLPIMTVVAIEMGCRSTHITSQLLDQSLEKPDNDIAKIIPALCVFMSLAPTFALVLIYMIYKRYNSRDILSDSGDYSIKKYRSQDSNIMANSLSDSDTDGDISDSDPASLKEESEEEMETVESVI